MVVAREAVIDEHRLALAAIGALAEHDVARLHIEMDHLLLVQGMQGGRDLVAERRHFFGRQRRFLEALAQRMPGQFLHHEVGHAFKTTAAKKPRHMHAGEQRHDHLLDLETHDRGRIARIGQHGNLHDGRARQIRMMHAPQRGHAAAMQMRFEHIPVDLDAGRQTLSGIHDRPQMPPSSRVARRCGRPATRTLRAAS